jgi:L-alanine-DL-glutamate epimerase-like enolase superfamily enzyme
MTLKMVRHTFYPLHVPYVRPIRWAGHIESGVDVLLLVIETDQGISGVGETPIRLNWHAATLKSLMVVIEEVFLPQMKDLDLADADAVRTCLGSIKEHPLAKSLIDTACWDLRARSAGVALWQLLGATDPKVPISWTVTRAAPVDMAREAETVGERYGIHAFKVKTGQGLDVDGAALRAIRRAVSDKAELYADSNSAHRAHDVPEMSKLLPIMVSCCLRTRVPWCPMTRFALFKRAHDCRSWSTMVVDHLRRLNSFSTLAPKRCRLK